MSAPDARAGTGEPAAWYERAAVPGLPDTAASAPSVRSCEEELAAIVLRAEQIGIPAWRVMVALELPPPPPPETR